MDSITKRVEEELRQAITKPCLDSARALEKALLDARCGKRVLGRVNQKSSIEAVSESDRGIVERLANAFDASLSAALSLAGLTHSKDLTPRVCARKLLCPSTDDCVWSPQHPAVDFDKPVVQFWAERPEARVRYRKYHPEDGLTTVLVADHGIGLEREEMPRTILTLNSDAKLRAFEAIGQFGQGGSCSLAFCESCLIVTKPRLAETGDDFYWTLVFPEKEREDSKQELLRRWFCDGKQLPFVGSLASFPQLKEALPGTLVWHYGYQRGGWINRITGPEQNNPWGRLGRLFFSYPLPFEIRGEFARADTEDGRRTIKGAFFRLAQEQGTLDYRSSEKSEDLVVEGERYGQFSVFVFVLKQTARVRNYLDPAHPIILTLNGQNHGEMTRTQLVSANYPELASSTIVEVRLDSLEAEALNEIVSNSREIPKKTRFTRALTERLIDLLSEDEALRELERLREEEKAKQSSVELNQKITRYLTSILSDARGRTGTKKVRKRGPRKRRARKPRPEIPTADPPSLLEFVQDRVLVAEGATRLAKFKSDGRPPKYTFHGDNPRLFASLQVKGKMASRLSIVGRADTDARGYGSISLRCEEEPNHPITKEVELGHLALVLQSADGSILRATTRVGVRPKPKENRTKQEPAVRTEIIFVAPHDADVDKLKQLIREDKILPFSRCTYLQKYAEALCVKPRESAYWAERADRDDGSVLQVEVNAGNPQLVSYFERCGTPDEVVRFKEYYLRDIVLDCYQHVFELRDVPRIVYAGLPNEDGARAAEIHLNHDKALRMAFHEIEASRKR